MEETKKCKHCQTDIPKSAKVCPNCRKKQGGKVKWIMIAIVVVIILGAALSSGEGGSDSSATKVGNVDVTTKKVSNIFKPGDVVKTDNLKITFISAEKYDSGNEYLQPTEGKEYYRMEFEFENISGSDQLIDSLMNCYADGYSMDRSYAIDKDELSFSSISAGKKIKGAVYYEVPKDAKEITLEYDLSFFNQKKVIFKCK